MAEDSDIQKVRELLGPDAPGAGWTDTRIGADLDAGLTTNDIAAAWWSFRAANTANLVNISEAGSSRSLQTIHAQSKALADAYTAKAAAEKATTDTPTRSRIRSHGITRV